MKADSSSFQVPPPWWNADVALQPMKRDSPGQDEADEDEPFSKYYKKRKLDHQETTDEQESGLGQQEATPESSTYSQYYHSGNFDGNSWASGAHHQQEQCQWHGQGWSSGATYADWHGECAEVDFYGQDGNAYWSGPGGHANEANSAEYQGQYAYWDTEEHSGNASDTEAWYTERPSGNISHTETWPDEWNDWNSPWTPDGPANQGEYDPNQKWQSWGTQKDLQEEAPWPDPKTADGENPLPWCKTGWQNKACLLISLWQMGRMKYFKKLIKQYSEHQAMVARVRELKSSIQKYGDDGPKKLGYLD